MSTLAKTEPTQLATMPEPSVAVMLQSAIQQGITPENATTLERMMNLYERMEDKRAEQAFAAAFVQLQSETPSVRATKPVPNNDGTVRYCFAPYEEIMATVQPLLKKYGFTVTFDTNYLESGRLEVSCTLVHEKGHSRTNKFAVRIGQGPPKASEMQADGSARTYAKRGALCDALNIVVDRDNDGAGDSPADLGAFVSDEQADAIKLLVESTGADKEKLFRFAGSSSYGTIPADRFEQIVSMLKKKEKGA